MAGERGRRTAQGDVVELSGSYVFGLPQEKLWDALMDPEVVGGCVPGVRAFEALGGGAFSYEISVRVGPVSASYTGKIEAVEQVRPESYRLVVSGAGGRTTVRGTGAVTLAPAGEGATTLTFKGDVQVAGMLARVGQRMLTTVARSQINQFFECLRVRAAPPQGLEV